MLKLPLPSSKPTAGPQVRTPPGLALKPKINLFGSIAVAPGANVSARRLLPVVGVALIDWEVPFSYLIDRTSTAGMTIVGPSR